MNKLFSLPIIFTPLLIIIVTFLNFNTYYHHKFNKLQIYDNFEESISKNEIDSHFVELMDYINWRKDSLDNDFFSSEDITHLQDVRTIVGGVYVLSIISILTLIFSYNSIKKDKWEQLKIASLINIVIFSAIGFLTFLNFNNSFILFHKILFRNDFWMLDPNTSNLIKYFPQEIFIEIAIYIFVFVIISALLGLIIWKSQIKKFSSLEDI